jgi:hypothetical protein
VSRFEKVQVENGERFLLRKKELGKRAGAGRKLTSVLYSQMVRFPREVVPVLKRTSVFYSDRMKFYLMAPFNG